MQTICVGGDVPIYKEVWLSHRALPLLHKFRPERCVYPWGGSNGDICCHGRTKGAQSPNWSRELGWRDVFGNGYKFENILWLVETLWWLIGWLRRRPMEVQGYIELRTTLFDENATKTITVKYITVNASSTYNLLLGRPSLNRSSAVASTTHMKMKLSSSKGGIITIKVGQKMARKCYESSLKKGNLCSHHQTRIDRRGRHQW